MGEAKQIFKRIVFPWTCLVSLMLFAVTKEASGVAIYVDDDTCPAVGTGTLGDPFCSIQVAIDSAAASPADNVLVHPGNYSPIVMKTGVNVLDADSSDEIKPAIVSAAGKVIMVQFLEGVQNSTLDGFLLDDAASTEDHAMMVMIGFNNKYADDALHNKNLTVSNCDFLASATAENHTRAGISLHATLQNINISNNTFRNIYGTAIVVGKHAPSPYPLKYSSVTIEDNIIENNAWGGIYLRAMPDMWNKLYIRNNTITSNMHETVPRGALGHLGIYLINIHRGYSKTDGTPREDSVTIPYCNDIANNICGATIEGNSISAHNLAGMLVESTWSISPHITGNHIFDNSLTGINILDSTQATIINNEINNNFRSGIAFNSQYRPNAGPFSRSLTIEGNDIHHNSFSGIGTIDYLTGSLRIKGNTIHHNAKAGIAFFNGADDVIIEDNHIYDNDTAGIYTGKWFGEPAERNRPGPDVKFDRSNGPVHLAIRGNKIYNNLAGMRLDHASGSISNNLVYANTRSGIRYSGKNVGGYEPFGMPWGIVLVRNNTVSDNGEAGIVYDNINYYPWCTGFYRGSDADNDGQRDFTDIPRMYRVDGIAPNPIQLSNNIVTWSLSLGLRDSTCDTVVRDYNLLHYNNWDDSKPNDEHFQFGGCLHNDNEIGAWYEDSPSFMPSDPLFIDRVGRDYHLQGSSPALGTGQSGEDMGAYGGYDPMNW